MKKVNLRNEFDSIEKYWTQKIVGKANGSMLKLAKGIGEINWHKHDNQDEVFIVYKGNLTIQLKDSEDINLQEGEMFIVPKGVEHAPKADNDVELLVIGIDVTSNEEGGKPEWSY
ncbi:cupin domain-containing protein [Fodinibius halophilus]|uniref:Cupin domain-containing protein n=1 Tax=Fodinibius halophilus TaxID=1736908 RepID=A0A6M1TQ12_9BACT|nr:cupin domain-containing protein [Fodinibius halophilus]NGP90300.1 cupin domain-containing protein [Fodinibius halophilus]